MTIIGLYKKLDLDELSNESVTNERKREIEHEIEHKAMCLVKKYTYGWKPNIYDEPASYAYLFAKTSFDFACTMRVLEEIKVQEVSVIIIMKIMMIKSVRLIFCVLIWKGCVIIKLNLAEVFSL
jgi:hypothetical protein